MDIQFKFVFLCKLLYCMTLLSCPQILHAEESAAERKVRLTKELYDKQGIKDTKLLDIFKKEHEIDLENVSKTGPWLVHVVIWDDIQDLNPELLNEYIGIFANIKELYGVEIRSEHFSNATINKLTILSDVKRIRLSINNKDYDDKSFHLDLAPLTQLTQLESLELSGNFTNSDLLKINRRNYKMRRLSLYSENIDGLFFKNYIDYFPNLESIYVAGHLKREALDTLLKYPKLKLLDIHNAEYDPLLNEMICENNYEKPVIYKLRLPMNNLYTLDKYKELAKRTIAYRKNKYPNNPKIWFINNPFINSLTQEELDKLK